MQRAIAYAALAEHLERLSMLPVSELALLVDGPATVLSVQVGTEELVLEFVVDWADTEHSALHIEGTARGPSTWRLEYLRECATVRVRKGGRVCQRIKGIV